MVELAKRDRAGRARPRRARRRRWRRPSTPTPRSASRSPPRPESRASIEASSCYAYLQAMAEGERRPQDRARLRDRASPAASIRSDRREGAERARRDARRRPSRPRAPARSCSIRASPPASPVSSAARSARTRCSAGARPFADRLGDEIASGAYVLADDGMDPERSRQRSLRWGGDSRGRTELIAEGSSCGPTCTTATRRRRGGAESTGNAGRGSLQNSQPSVETSNLVSTRGSWPSSSSWAAQQRRLRHRGRRPPLGRQSGDRPLLGRGVRAAIRGGELAEPLREFTIAGDLLGSPAGGAGGGVPRHGGCPSAARSERAPMLVGEMAYRRFLATAFGLRTRC